MSDSNIKCFYLFTFLPFYFCYSFIAPHAGHRPFLLMRAPHLPQIYAQRNRVKYIPDPKSFVSYYDAGGVERQVQEGRLSKRILRSDKFAIIASYGADELIQANFDVVSFSMTTKIGTVDATGDKLTNRQLQDINRLERGDLITFRNIKAKGPDGKIRTLGLLQIEIV